VLPVPRIAFAEQTLNSVAPVPDMDSMTNRESRDHEQTIAIPSESSERRFGAYAVAVRKCRAAGCPHHTVRTDRQLQEAS
jgi:hypothetical protein